MADQIRYRTMTTVELRETFLLSDLFHPGKICATYVDLDRAVIASAVPLEEPLRLPTYDLLKAAYFLERRELGVLNIGGAGSVTVNGQVFELKRLDGLYIGRGHEKVIFASADLSHPAEFYLLSYPAHAVYPMQLARSADLSSVKLGSAGSANAREIRKFIYLDGIRSSQLVMGYTQLAAGSVWNTMPSHTHSRRSEIYLYFDVAEGERVIHMMGPAQETRHLIIANKQVAVSPGWSIHSGVGTSNYAFCWGMGGENQAYDDMDALKVSDLL
jgi:4-deoxy-L-threo-5-hexosulose-uronate ketol-isomerase